MKKILILFLTMSIFLFTNCMQKDPLIEIRRLARSSDIQKKEEAAKQYKLAIDTLVKAYIHLGSLNKAVGEKLMFNKNYSGAIKHLEIAREVRNEDANVYYWLGVCHVNLYKIGGKNFHLIEAEKNYKIALKFVPDHMDILYSYAHLLVYAKKDYQKAVGVLNKYIYQLNPLKPTQDPKAYFLLARVYYILGNFKKAYDTYNEMYKFKKILTKVEKNKLEEFIIETQRKIGGE